MDPDAQFTSARKNLQKAGITGAEDAALSSHFLPPAGMLSQLRFIRFSRGDI
jgi:hypothetical protein